MPEPTLEQVLLQKATGLSRKPQPVRDALRTLRGNALEGLAQVLGNRWISQPLFESDPIEPDDMPYLRQYLHPDQQMLEPQHLRPTQLSDTPDIPFYKLGMLPKSRQDALIVEEGDQVGSPGIPNFFPQLGFPGHYVSSIGQDEAGPYLSAYDEWDFNSPVIKPLIGKLMSKVGRPFAIYDRYPLQEVEDPTTSEIETPGRKYYRFR